MNSKEPSSRIQSIDLLRGLIMVIMGLDHVREYFHNQVMHFQPEDLENTYPLLFGTRWVTHFCAPGFMLLAGTAAYLMGQKMTKSQLSKRLISRGFWLILLEVTIIKIGWNLNFDYSFIGLSVIWALGLCMIFLAGIVRLPEKIGVGISLIIIFGHNLFDQYTPVEEGFWSVIWKFLHVKGALPLDGGATLYIAYPVLSYLGLMALGYYLGKIYQRSYEPQNRKRLLIQMGLGAILLFFILRIPNLYGDPVPWESFDAVSTSIMSFFNVNKYPPSLQFLLITVGPMLLFLAFAEKWQGRWTKSLLIFGGVPLFFYTLHIYLVHISAIVAGYLFKPAGQQALYSESHGYDLIWVYVAWVFVVLILYPFCRWHHNFKTSNRDVWWTHWI